MNVATSPATSLLITCAISPLESILHHFTVASRVRIPSGLRGEDERAPSDKSLSQLPRDPDRKSLPSDLIAGERLASDPIGGRWVTGPNSSPNWSDATCRFSWPEWGRRHHRTSGSGRRRRRTGH